VVGRSLLRTVGELRTAPAAPSPAVLP